MPEPLDIDPKELGVLKEKIKRTNALKQEYLRQAHNPYRHATGDGGYVFDPAVQRYNALRAGGYEHFKPTWRNGLLSFGIVVVPMILMYKLLRYERDTRENLIRTGQIAYTDRNFKFQ